MGEMNK